MVLLNFCTSIRQYQYFWFVKILCIKKKLYFLVSKSRYKYLITENGRSTFYITCANRNQALQEWSFGMFSKNSQFRFDQKKHDSDKTNSCFWLVNIPNHIFWNYCTNWKQILQECCLESFFFKTYFSWYKKNQLQCQYLFLIGNQNMHTKKANL